MTTREIYNLAVLLGKKADLRGEAKVQKYLDRVKKSYDRLTVSEQAEFDREKLSNPYSDSHVLLDNNKGQIKKIMVGIDIGGDELLLADRLGDIDLVVAHHPLGQALGNIHDVMKLQAQIFASFGVPINVAEAVNQPRLGKVERSTTAINYHRQIDMAKLLNLDLICLHTTADNLAARYTIALVKHHQDNLETLADVMKMLKKVPEYQQAILRGFPPKIFVGNPDSSCGRVVVDFTGGTSPAKEIYQQLSQAGVGTVITMHIPEDSKEEAEKYHLNIVIADHMASDSLGLNLFLDQLEKQGVEVMTTSGLIRVKRF